jgi:hypothetical protein
MGSNPSIREAALAAEGEREDQVLQRARSRLAAILGRSLDEAAFELLPTDLGCSSVVRARVEDLTFRIKVSTTIDVYLLVGGSSKSVACLADVGHYLKTQTPPPPGPNIVRQQETATEADSPPRFLRRKRRGRP